MSKLKRAIAEAAKREREECWRTARRAAATPMRVAFRLAWGLTVNHYFAEYSVASKTRPGEFVVRKHPSSEALTWRKLAHVALLEQRIPRYQLSGRLAINVMACPPNAARRDLDNLLKGLFDALTHCNVVHDDSDFDDVRIYRGPITAGGAFCIEILELPGAATVSGNLFGPAPPRPLLEALEVMGAPA